MNGGRYRNKEIQRDLHYQYQRLIHKISYKDKTTNVMMIKPKDSLKIREKWKTK